MRVFITGGAGFIGSHLCDALVAQGEEVIILDNLSTGSKKNIAHLEGRIEVIQGDIRDQKLVEVLIKDCDLVLHMAAALGVENILQDPIESISTNLYGSEVVLNAALKFNKRIIIASTSEIYGRNLNQPLTETDDRVLGVPQKLRWTYSDAKALEEASAHHLFLTKGLKVTTIRFFNTVGPRQTGKYGMVIPRFIESSLNNNPVNIFGDGSQSRVFCHVTDSVRAVLSLASNNSSIGEVFNVGGEQEITILDLAKKVINQLESKSKIHFIPYREAFAPGYEDIVRRVPDISKVKKFLNWNPVKDLTKIIDDVARSIGYRNFTQP
jgi:UDP-glucose 4-epimerase